MTLFSFQLDQLFQATLEDFDSTEVVHLRLVLCYLLRQHCKVTSLTFIAIYCYAKLIGTLVVSINDHSPQLG